MALAAAAMGLMALVGCDRSSPPKEIETVDVGPGLQIDTSGDQEARRIESGLVGVMPGDFPSDLPLYLPASLVDFGESASGRPTVSLMSPDGISQVRRELYAALRKKGWTASSAAGGRVALKKGRRSAWLHFEDGRPGTLYRFEY